VVVVWVNGEGAGGGGGGGRRGPLDVPSLLHTRMVSVGGEEEEEEEEEEVVEEEEEEEVVSAAHPHPGRGRPERPPSLLRPPLGPPNPGPRAPERAAWGGPAPGATWWSVTAVRTPCCSPCARTGPTRAGSSTSVTAAPATSSCGRISRSSRGRSRGAPPPDPPSPTGRLWALGTASLGGAGGRGPLQRPCATVTRWR
jgi:hypothetical protein